MNGDFDNVDPPVSRALLALATALGNEVENIAKDVRELTSDISAASTRFAQVGGGLIIALVGAALTVVFRG